MSNIEQEIKAKQLTAPRITSDHIDQVILKEDYHVFPGTTVTICLLTLANGFSVTGESACTSSANFDIELGRKIARENARNKIWQLEGYLLRQMLHVQAMQDMGIGDAIAAMRLGHKVARKGWNGKGMWLAISPGAESLPADKFWGGPNREFAESNGGAAKVLPAVTMKTATGEILMGWLASQSDLLANDWCVVE